MLKFNKQALGKATQSRTALVLFAAAAFTGGTTSEASARPYRHHHYHHHYSHHVRAESPSREANASVGSSFGGRSFSGMASFYGNESGRQTASGQRFNQEAMTAAHRSLPFGTKLRVTHGSRSVVVTINDRGPFVRGRVLDLSTGAARAIGLTSAGVGHVTAEVM
ncbi:MAG TPA: septal ring lytic transglycosylase RlpA family protein [Bradyrhizobium sp.]|uniref:septal ring lytic transglycosylase RlpA family protein n=1 Tax=Bradyrhizobium sp. TaxID=376 RepID=UPI002D80AD59|nr:septal ring lytic transglycosylase RlpA family protein [Bradyrhizobium sp.]HET7888014.1 septal ring lytic transglycosylase RlpA family protein [Bradyrhizobium sp.]